jgi:phosphatidylglycerophosphate synthase
MADIEKHKRVHDMLLGPLERPALKWFSERMPAWVTPDKLTAFGVVGALLVFLGYGLTHNDIRFVWLANLGYLINWFGDSLDGTVARFRKIERPKYGFFLDHTVDTFNMVLIFVGLGVSTFVRLDIAALACIGYLLMSIFAYVNAFVSGEFQISYARIGPTEMRAIGVLANIGFLAFGNPSFDFGFRTLTIFDIVVLLVAAAEIIAYIFTVRGAALKWSRLDP